MAKHRAAWTILAAVAGILLTAVDGRTQSKGLALGETHEGEIKNNKGTDVPIKLKAGQDVSISVTVTGKDREFYVILYDPNGVALGRKAGTKTVQLEVQEVSDAGTYKIHVNSGRTGPFTLKATATPDAEIDEKALKAKIAAKEEELAELKKKLKALQEKKSK